MKTLLISLILAVAAYFIPTQASDPAARALAPVIALLATGIFPCMSLVVGAMKGEHRTPALVNQLYEKLRKLMRLLVAVFAVAVCSIGALAISISLSAQVNAALPDKPASVAVTVSAHATFALAMFLIAMLVGRVVDLGRAFFAILEINKTHALLIARARAESERVSAIRSARSARFPEDDLRAKPLERVN